MDVVESNFAELGGIINSTNDGNCSLVTTNTRGDMVDAAFKFMINPKVSGSSLEQQDQFLIRKGLSGAEIAAARQRANEKLVKDGNSFNDDHVLPAFSDSFMKTKPQDSSSDGGGFMSFLNAAVSIGCVSYVGYKLFRSYILPNFFKIPDPAAKDRHQLENQISDLQNSMKFVMDSAVQTLNKVHEQQECLHRALSIIEQNTAGSSKQLESDISIIKSLLLNPAVKLGGTDNAIPRWQEVQPACKKTDYWKPMANDDDDCCSEAENTE